MPKVVTAAELLAALWRNFAGAAPHAEALCYALAERGEILSNDHVALRTFALPGLDAEALARPFEALGWRRCAAHPGHCGQKAHGWQHDDPHLPRVMISELALDVLSPAAQAAVPAPVGQPPPRPRGARDLLRRGRPRRRRPPGDPAAPAPSRAPRGGQRVRVLAQT